MQCLYCVRMFPPNANPIDFFRMLNVYPDPYLTRILPSVPIKL